MKIFVIGGTPHPDNTPEREADVRQLDLLMADFVRGIAKSGHEVITSSPFVGSADRSLMDAFAKLRKTRSKVNVELHFPATSEIVNNINQLTAAASNCAVQCFRHPEPIGNSKEASSNAWLFSQIYALERCHAVLAIGGKLDGTANLLLLLAEAKHKPILPIPLLAGASERCYWRNKFQLIARLGDASVLSMESESSKGWISLTEQLADPSTGKPKKADRSGTVFFISYSRAEPQDADLVEMLLRRRNLTVFRDERDFEAGNLIESEISKHINTASVFIALYSRAYACSPWCYDELKAATALHDKGNGHLMLWVLERDGTRMVLPEARDIVTIPARNRAELEGKLNDQLERYLNP